MENIPAGTGGNTATCVGSSGYFPCIKTIVLKSPSMYQHASKGLSRQFYNKGSGDEQLQCTRKGIIKEHLKDGLTVKLEYLEKTISEKSGRSYLILLRRHRLIQKVALPYSLHLTAKDQNEERSKKFVRH